MFSNFVIIIPSIALQLDMGRQLVVCVALVHSFPLSGFLTGYHFSIHSFMQNKFMYEIYSAKFVEAINLG